MLTPEQESAVDKIHRFLKDDDAWEFHLGGFAGTGKTYLLQYLINEKPAGEMVCCAPTGKAASVLQAKLKNTPVSTVHRFLYRPVQVKSPELEELKVKYDAAVKEGNDPELIENLRMEMRDERAKLAKMELAFDLKEDVVGSCKRKLVIVDEASMVTSGMRDDLQSTGAKVIFVGDPGQLPPVGDGGWFLTMPFDYVLETIHRQALDSPIIRMSMDIRNRSIKKSDYVEGNAVIRNGVDDSVLTEFDQVITGRNATRHRLNRKIRYLLGFKQRTGKLPCEGERIICLKNERVIVDDDEFDSRYETYTNGIQAVVACNSLETIDGISDLYPSWYFDIYYNAGNFLRQAVRVYPYHFLANYDNDLEVEQRDARQAFREFDYAYAITAHKSQGSEWDRVIVFDDKMRRNDKEFRQRWLYTAVTRAKREMILVQET